VKLVRYIAAAIIALAALPVNAAQQATGRVYHDTDNDQTFDQGEQLLSGIRVSNGREIATTDEQGSYTLPVDNDTILFVIKPKGWRTPLSKDNLPRFYYIHKPAGSPKSRFPGVAPTGPLPASVDFALYPQEEPEEFKAIFFGDPQPRDEKEVEYVYHDVVEQLIGTDASFGVTLGDIAFNSLNTLESQNRGIAMIGIPWYNVIGNHDTNQDTNKDSDSDETFHRIYGPNYYSFDYGNTHFITLDDINWQGRDKKKQRGPYKAGLDEEQMAFVKNDLAMIPPDQLVVLMMHIPLWAVNNRHELYRLIEKRPFSVSISGHTHSQEHHFIGEDGGWHGSKPHHHIVNVTVCGSWWSGEPDELGIPHATMRDGAPNGYSVMTFNGSQYDWKFVAARRPDNYQMNIWAPETVSADRSTTEILVNVFGGSERSTVEMKLGTEDNWTTMKKVHRMDPYALQIKAQEEALKPEKMRREPVVPKSTHLWKGMLPEKLTTGTHVLTVRTKDMFGNVYISKRLIKSE